MNIRLYNARILTMADGMKVIDNGQIWISDGMILYVGDGSDTKEVYAGHPVIVWDREMDMDGDLLMPGFKDAHTHSGMTLFRSLADDMKLDRWLNELIFPREARLSAEDISICTKLAVLEYLTSGITAVFDMYLTPLSIAQATEECGMRCVQVGGMNNFSQSVEEQEDWYERLNSGNPLTSYMLGFHAEYTCSKELLEKLSLLSHKLKAPVFAHNSETAGEVQGCRERYGMTPTEFMEELGLFDYGGGGYHCVHMTEHDIEIFRKHGLSAVTNPASNAKLASGIAPISALLNAGVNLAIGTDGPASNNCLDMFREMFLVTALAKLRENDASAVDADKVLYMATAGGAKAMGLSDCDVLAAGKRADIIAIGLKQPNMQPLNNITKNIVYSGSKSNVRMTMINGRILYEDGRFSIGISPDEIYREVDRIVSSMRNV